MEEVIRKILNYIIENKYPMFTDVNVTSEPVYSYYIDKNKNLVFNVALTINSSDFEPINDSGEWEKIKSDIREIIKMTGIDNRIWFYIYHPDKD
jgi:hypothetical protein